MEFSAHGETLYSYNWYRVADGCRQLKMVPTSVDLSYWKAVEFLTDKDPFRFNLYMDGPNQWEGKSLIDMALEGNDCVDMVAETYISEVKWVKVGEEDSQHIQYAYSCIIEALEKCMTAINEYSNLTGEKRDMGKIKAAVKYYDGKRNEWKAVSDRHNERVDREIEKQFKAKEAEIFQ